MRVSFVMVVVPLALLAAGLVVSMSVHADEGMWVFNNLPLDRLKARYGASQAAIDSAVASYQDTLVGAARDVAMQASTMSRAAATTAVVCAGSPTATVVLVVAAGSPSLPPLQPPRTSTAPARPIARPAAPIRSACPTTSERTSAARAPSAIRIPISRRRGATEYAMTP